MRKGGAFIGDAGYDAESIRSAAKARGMKVVIPSNPNASGDPPATTGGFTGYAIASSASSTGSSAVARSQPRYEKTARPHYLAPVALGVCTDLARLISRR